MKNNPFCASFLRRICGLKAPFIGVFLFITLVFFNQTVFADDQNAPVVDSPTQETVATPDSTSQGNTVPVINQQIEGQTDLTSADTTSTGAQSLNSNTPKGLVKPIVPTDFKSPTLGKYISPTVSTVDGSLNYDYPIVVPAGRNGFGPDIKLSYNNNNKSHSSIVGIGWSLNIPYIQRVNVNGTDKMYSNNNFFSSLDGLLVDQGNGIYTPRTENGSFLKYKYQNNSWTVTDKRGIQYLFGATSQARQDNLNDTSKVFSWMLESQLDTNGNTILYKYFKDRGQIYPDVISYNQEGKFSVEFSRASIYHLNKSYIPAFAAITAYRISEIKIKIDGTVVNKYSIANSSIYDGLVTNISVEGYKGTQTFSLPPVQFGYGTDVGQKKWNLESNFLLPTDSNSKVVTLDFNSTSNYGNKFIDLNGDGLPDIVRWDSSHYNGYSSVNSGNQVFLNTGSGFILAPNFLLPTYSNGQVMVLDFNYGTTALTSPYYGSSFKDINGDGLPDVVAWYAGRKYGIDNGNAVFLNTGTSFQFASNFKLPTDYFGNVLTLDYNNTNHYGNSFQDVNGDGLPDVVRWSAGQPNGYSTINYGNQVFLNSKNIGFQIAPNFKLPTDSANQVLVLDYNEATGAYGNSFQDVNGDGFLDIVRWSAGQKNGYVSASPQNLNGNQVFINTGSSFEINSNFLLPTDNKGYVVTLDFKTGNIWSDNNYGNKFIDINNDGLLDVVRWRAGEQNGFSAINYGNQVFLNTGNGFTLDPNFLLPTDSSGKVLTLDYSYGINSGGASGAYGNSFQDINGDGLIDIVRWRQGQPNGYSNPNRGNGNQVFINTGSDFELDSNYQLPTDSLGNVLALDYNSSNVYGNSYQDINGDGLPDFVRWTAGATNGFSYSSGYYSYGNQVFLSTVGRKEIRKVTNSSGGVHSFVFKGIRQFTNLQNVGLNSNIPDEYKTFVVFSDNSNDNNGVSGTTTYQYHGAYYDQRRFNGFSEIIENNPDGSIITTKYHQNNGETGNEPLDSVAQIGKPFEETLTDSLGNLYSRTRTKYIETGLGSKSSSIQISSQLSQVYDGNSSHKDIAEEYYYDNYGNLIQKISLGEVLGTYDGSSYVDTGSDKFTENILYATSISGYVVGLPSIDTVLDQNAKKVRESKFYYDNWSFGLVDKGNQTKQESWKSGTTYVNSQKTYNFLGLVTASTNENGKITHYIYDSYNLYPKIITDPLGHFTQYSYDYSTGKPNQTIDQNGYIYQTVFDGFGRILQEKIPDIISSYPLIVKTQYVYTDTLSGDIVKRTDYLNTDIGVDTYQYFDGFSNLIQERKEAEIANNFNVRDLVYNNIGLLQKESLKYVSTGSAKTSPTSLGYLYNNYTYDVSNRVVITTNSLGSTKTIYDDWMTSEIGPTGKAKNYYKDAYGNLVKVEEKNGGNTYTTNYEWNGNKSLTKIADALLNVRNFTYDGLGKRLTAEDLHTLNDTNYGIWTYVYDDAGNMTRSVSPNGEVVNYAYDDLGRKASENYTGTAGVEIAYTYDCTDYVGKLCNVVKAGANTSYTYNSNSLIATEKKVLGGITYVTSYAYDWQGDIVNITYPDNSEVKYIFNSAGLLEKIQRKESGGTFSDVVSNFDYSPMGQVTTQVDQNGVTNSNIYDDGKLYELIRKTTQNSLGLKLQDQKYVYDNVGNITSISNSSNTNLAKIANYTYDDLSRLTIAAITNTPNNQNYTETYSYDAIGNILKKSSQDIYMYGDSQGSSYANPHAVTNISNSGDYSFDLTYDKNGNLVNKATTTSVILNGTVNPDGRPTNAWFEISWSPSNIETTHQNIGSGSSAIVLSPTTIVNLMTNFSYSFRVVSNNSYGTTYGNWITFKTGGDHKPIIFSATVSTPSMTSAIFNGQVNGSGGSTDVWYESSKTGSQQLSLTHLDDCNTTYTMPTYYFTGTPSYSYQFRVVAKNSSGTTYSDWISFQMKDPPPTPPALPPPPTYPPLYMTASVTPLTPLYLYNDVDYTWNYRNELTGVSSDVNDDSYLYDDAGNRVQATIDGVTTYYPNKYYEVTGTQKTKYIYAGDTLVATVKTVGSVVTPSYIHTDHLGSTEVVSDSTGAIAQLLDYYPFGAERICSGKCDTEKKFIGQYTDGDLALNYLNARYYNSSNGRFISEDPMFWNPEGQGKDMFAKLLSDPQSQNSYSYARNNPIILIDPSGLFNIFGSEKNEIAVGNWVNGIYEKNSVARFLLDHPYVPAVVGAAPLAIYGAVISAPYVISVASVAAANPVVQEAVFRGTIGAGANISAKALDNELSGQKGGYIFAGLTGFAGGVVGGEGGAGRSILVGVGVNLSGQLYDKGGKDISYLSLVLSAASSVLTRGIMSNIPSNATSKLINSFTEGVINWVVETPLQTMRVGLSE